MATVAVEATCTEPGPQIVPSSADSLLPGQNFGTATSLQVGPAYLRLLAQQRALVGFDLTPVPERCALAGATRRLYATEAMAGRTIEALRIAEPWSGSEVRILRATQLHETPRRRPSSRLPTPGRDHPGAQAAGTAVRFRPCAFAA